MLTRGMKESIVFTKQKLILSTITTKYNNITCTTLWERMKCENYNVFLLYYSVSKIGTKWWKDKAQKPLDKSHRVYLSKEHWRKSAQLEYTMDKQHVLEPMKRH